MLIEKMKFISGNMTSTLRQQQENANEVDVKYRQVTMELSRAQEDYELKISELEKLDQSNDDVKSAQYDRKIEELSRQLQNHERARTEFQNKFENMHNAFTCKLQLYVTDIRQNSEQTQNDLKSIENLLSNMKT